jgi:ribosomal-protein-alanine N-acetyltransferase
MNLDQMAALHSATKNNMRGWSVEEYFALSNDSLTVLFSGDHGFALGRVVHDEAELLMIIVQPNQQSRGFGRTYLCEFELECRKRGAENCVLEVSKNNIAAKSLYFSSGYEKIGIRKLYYQLDNNDRLDALILKKILV